MTFYIFAFFANFLLFASATFADQIPTGRISATHIEVYDDEKRAFQLIRNEGQVFHGGRQPLLATFQPDLLKGDDLSLFCEGFEPFHELYIGGITGRVETPTQISTSLADIRFIHVSTYSMLLTFRSDDYLISGIIQTGRARYDGANICPYDLEDNAGFSSFVSVVYSDRHQGYAGCCHLKRSGN
ncbi:hypothetical protein [Halocynthiibacter sp.]|uniref:hypothetical protein n=1 Tax=Halocynthiibacter sp. TaxID=1979210 RepID=UPI003C53A090